LALLPGQTPWNPYHVHEYRPQEIVKLCKQAGIEGSAIAGVIGRHGAQALELHRVRQSPFVVYGGHYGKYIQRVLRRLGSSWRQPLPLDPDRQVTTQDRSTSWFELSPTYEDGLDFWMK